MDNQHHGRIFWQTDVLNLLQTAIVAEEFPLNRDQVRVRKLLADYFVQFGWIDRIAEGTW